MAPAPHVYWAAAPATSSTDISTCQQQPEPVPACAPPIASLLATLKRRKKFTLEPSEANKDIGPLVLHLDASDEELQILLSKYGWCGEQGFTRALDTKGLQAALQKYQYLKVEVIGRGAYGSVHKVMNRETREMQAIKQVKMSAHGLCEATIREISTLKELDHCNIVKLRDVIAAMPSKYCYLVLELLDTDLFTYLNNTPALEMSRVKSIMFQVLSGLHHAHTHSIMHRDLKPQNILLGAVPVAHSGAMIGSGPAAPAPGGGGWGSVSPRLRVKVADFGLARPYLPSTQDGGAYTDWVVTLFYRAPELLLGCRHYGPSVDIWSAGCVLAELLNVAPLFSANCEIELLFNMFNKLGTPTPEEWAELPGFANFNQEYPRWSPTPVQQLVPRLASDPLGADLLSRMLTYDPRRRITASQAMEHPWFNDVRADEVMAAAAATREESAAAAMAAAL